MENKKDNKVSKDWVIAVLSVLGFFGILKLASWANIGELFNFLSLYVVVAKVAITSAVIWSFMKYVCGNTLGKHFGKKFDEGWEEFSNVEKARWIIGVFLVMFYAIMTSF